jgi:hypothetical protein
VAVIGGIGGSRVEWGRRESLSGKAARVKRWVVLLKRCDGCGKYLKFQLDSFGFPFYI